jgi:hypothetical protein
MADQYQPDIDAIVGIPDRRERHAALIAHNGHYATVLQASGAQIDGASIVNLRIEALVNVLDAPLDVEYEVGMTLRERWEVEYETLVARMLLDVIPQVRQSKLLQGVRQPTVPNVFDFIRGNGHQGP